MILSRSNVVDFWDKAQSGFWLVPSVIVLVAALGGFGLIWLDRYLLEVGADSLPGIGGMQADAAQAILSTIASSMIMVAGVTFSITVVALQLASTQLGPRLLRTFMVDAGTQVVLGVFIATFLYCLIVLGVLGGEGGFVPQYAIAGGILLGLVNIAVLIYFIHHIASAIRVENVIAALEEDISAAIDTLFPEELGQEPPNGGTVATGDPPAEFEHDAVSVRSRQGGYVRHIDEVSLLGAAGSHDLVLRLDIRPGDFVIEGGVLVSAWPGERISDEIAAQIQESVALGPQRTPLQDVGFALQQLVEVGVRALSQAFNDPFTALACIDRLGQALCRLAPQPLPSPYRYDENGKLRVMASVATLAEMTRAAADPIARAGADNVEIMVRLIGTILLVAERARHTGDRTQLLDLARDLREQGESRISDRRDRQTLVEQYEVCLARFQARVRHLATVPAVALTDVSRRADGSMRVS